MAVVLLMVTSHHATVTARLLIAGVISLVAQSRRRVPLRTSRDRGRDRVDKATRKGPVLLDRLVLQVLLVQIYSPRASLALGLLPPSY